MDGWMTECGLWRRGVAALPIALTAWLQQFIDKADCALGIVQGSPFPSLSFRRPLLLHHHRRSPNIELEICENN